mmetsp:Transcript_95711/g.292711  ORF Transcript_95711/g.292711 Transcript_95711/m.292711 type:complete len:230 (-) Transcript_95711:622-1311(-)
MLLYVDRGGVQPEGNRSSAEHATSNASGVCRPQASLITCTKVSLCNSPLLLARTCTTSSQPDARARATGSAARFRLTQPVTKADKLLTAAGLRLLTISAAMRCGRPAKAPMAVESRSAKVHPEPASLASNASRSWGCNSAPNESPTLLITEEQNLLKSRTLVRSFATFCKRWIHVSFAPVLKPAKSSATLRSTPHSGGSTASARGTTARLARFVGGNVSPLSASQHANQ